MQEQPRQTLLPGLKLFYEYPIFLRGAFRLCGVRRQPESSGRQPVISPQRFHICSAPVPSIQCWRASSSV